MSATGKEPRFTSPYGGIEACSAAATHEEQVIAAENTIRTSMARLLVLADEKRSLRLLSNGRDYNTQHLHEMIGVNAVATEITKDEMSAAEVKLMKLKETK